MYPSTTSYTRRFRGREIEFSFRVPASAADVAEKVIRTILGMIRSIEESRARAHSYWNSPDRMLRRMEDDRNPARLTNEEFSFLMADVADAGPTPPDTASGASAHGPLHRLAGRLMDNAAKPV